MDTPPALPPLREVIAAHDLGARKSLGQHFLLDLNITRKIVKLADVGPEDSVLEVGPGPGGLTRALLEAGASVTAIERDARCIAALQDLVTAYPGRFRLLEGDALTADIRATTDGAPLVKIIANLPYNISTELLIRWLKANHKGPEPDRGAQAWRLMALMFQKEVADRILAAPGSKAYGRLSVLAQAAAVPARGFDLPARAFTPPPKVDSSVVLFTPTPSRLDCLPALERITQAAFSQRRKMLRSAMKPLWGAETEARLDAAGVSASARAEEISVAAFVKMAEAA